MASRKIGAQIAVVKVSKGDFVKEIDLVCIEETTIETIYEEAKKRCLIWLIEKTTEGLSCELLSRKDLHTAENGSIMQGFQLKDPV